MQANVYARERVCEGEGVRGCVCEGEGVSVRERVCVCVCEGVLV